MSTSYYFSQLSLILVVDVNRTLQKPCGFNQAITKIEICVIYDIFDEDFRKQME